MKAFGTNITTWLQSRRLRYIVAGGWNTAFGYCIGVGMYLLLATQLYIAEIAVLSNIVSITMSYTVYRLFVFRSRGPWLIEYLKCYVVYGGSALLSIALLWAFIKVEGLNIWIAQAGAITITVAVSYIGHSKFTFSRITDTETIK